MSLLNTLRSMPYSVLGLAVIFLLVPFFSLSFLEGPDRTGWLKFTILVIGYWVVPLGVAYSLVWRHHWFLPLYLAQCVLLTLHTILTPGQAMEIQVARILLIGLMVYVGVLFGNRNFLYPLLTRQFRLWRRAIRYRVGRAVTLSADAVSDVPALLVDCSKAGAQLTVHPEDRRRLPALRTGTRLTLHVPGHGEFPDRALPLAVAWSGESAGAVRIGCRALDKTAMGAYVKAEVLKQQAAVRLPELRNYTLEQDIQETALVLWLVCIALSFALPAFG